MKKSIIYLDNNATTPLDTEVYQAMLSILKENYGNPSSSYNLGYEAKNEITQARESVAKLINADSEQIIFTSGASEANNLAILGYCLKEKQKKHIITSSIEHPSVLEVFNSLKECYGFEVSYAPVNRDGILKVDSLKELITENTALISVMMVNNEIGTIQPVQEIGELCKERNIHFHCDAVQGAGKLSIDMYKLNIDTMSISAHKFHGPKGVGCLYVRNPQTQAPLLYGGSQENGLRAGTENVAGIVGFGKTAENALRKQEQNTKKIIDLRKLFLNKLSLNLPEWNINGRNTVPSTISLSFNGVRGEALAFALNKAGICVSIASACSSFSSKPSHVLKAMGKSEDEIRNTIRLSIGKQNTLEEMAKAAEEISLTVSKLRSFSSKISLVRFHNSASLR